MCEGFHGVNRIRGWRVSLRTKFFQNSATRAFFLRSGNRNDFRTAGGVGLAHRRWHEKAGKMGLGVKGEHEYLGVTGKSFAQKSQAQNPVLRPARELFYDKCFVFESGAMPSGRGRNFFKIPLRGRSS